MSSHPPRCHRACGFHRTRRPHERISSFSCSADIGKDSQAFTFSGVTTRTPFTVWPFALYVAFPRADYYGHADCGRGPRRIGITCVLPSLALLAIPMSLSHVHPSWTQTRSRRWQLPTNLYLLLQAPQWARVDQVRPCHFFAALRGLTASRWKEHPLCSFPHTDCPIRQAETGVDFPVGCHLLRLDSPLISQPSTASWRLASRLTAPFRGMLLTGLERPIPLSPNGSGVPDRTQGDFSHSMAMLHGAPRTVYTDLNGLLCKK